jgi:carboxyl-terminal processing protease
MLKLRPFRAFAGTLLVLASILSATAQTLTVEQKTEVLDGIDKIVMERAFVPNIDLKLWPEHLAKHREAIDKAEQQGDFVREVNRALREFGFSHIRLRTPTAAEARQRTSVIGVGLTARPEADGLVVLAVTPKSPAEELGVKPGWKIVEVDGKVPENPAVLTGDEGTDVALKIKDEAGEVREITLKRQRFSVFRPDTLTWADDESAVLRIQSFSRGYNQKAIEELMAEAAKAKYLVLDLRSNGGGLVNNLQHLLSLLMPPDTQIGAFISRSTFDAYVKEKPGPSPTVEAIAEWSTRKYKTSKKAVEPFAGKVAVLVNRGSASASEICAAALRENLHAPLVGARTAGAVLASVYGKLPQGFEIQYPISDYVTAQGRRLEANPLDPDAEAAGSKTEDGKDPGVEKALELLKAGG